MIKLPQFLSNMFSPIPEPTLNQQAGLTENWQPVESTPIQPGNPTTYAGGNPPGIQPPSMAPYFSGSIPPAMQLQPDTVRTQYGSGSIPSARLMPVGPAGQAGLSSAIQSVVSQQAGSGSLITLSMPAQYIVTPGSNISVSWIPVASNLGLFGPASGATTLPTFRSMVAADEPSTTVNSVTNDTNIHGSIAAQNLTLSWSGLLAIARGGTGTATPNLVAGSNITITGSWPNQTISSSGGGIGGVSKIYTNYLATSADNGTLLSFDSSNSSGGSSGGGVTLTLPSPPPSNKWVIFVENIGAGLLVVSPNGLDIDNSPSSLGVTQFQGLAIFTDGVNYFTETGLSEGGGGGGGGTVLSVAMTVPSWLSVSGSPVTAIGTLAVTAAGGQTANQVLATPNGTTGALIVRALVVADLPSSVATSVVNDTNVTGSITAQALTLGWTGTLAAGRLNANVVQGITNDTNITGTISAQNLTLGWTGTLAAGRLNSNVVQGITNGTNVTGTISAQNLTLGWTGQLSVANGGTGTASPGLVAGANITITGSWPNQTIATSGQSGIGGVKYLHASYLAASGDAGKLLSFDSSSSSSSSLTLTLPNPPPSTTWAVFVENIGIGNLIVNPNGLQLDSSSASLNLSQYQGLVIFTDGSNYYAETGLPEGVSNPTFFSSGPYYLQDESSSAFATKGNVVTCLQAITIYRFIANVYGNNGDVYNAAILTMSSATAISGILATSNSFTFSATETGQVIFTFSSPPTLTAGSIYAFVIQITSGSGTTPCQIDTSGVPTAFVCPGVTSTTSFARIASVSPSSGTMSTGSGPYFISVVGAF